MDSQAYFVIDPATGNKYGPADIPTLNQWASEGRVLPSTMLEDALSGAQLRADRLPGLILAPPPTPPSMSPPPESVGLRSAAPAHYVEEGWRGFPIGVHFDFLNDSWGLMKKSIQAWVPVLLFTLLVYFVCQLPTIMVHGFGALIGEVSFDVAWSGAYLVTSLISALLSLFVLYPLYYGLFGFALDIVDGKTPEFARIFTPFRRWFGVVGGYFVYSLLSVIGMFFCILPGIYIQGRLFYWPLMLAEERMGFMDTFSYVWDRQGPFAWAMWGLTFVCGLLAVVGMFALVVGLLATIPMALLTLAAQYRAMYPEFAPKADKGAIAEAGLLR